MHSSVGDGTIRKYTSSLKLVATSFALRVDAKFADTSAIDALSKVRSLGCFELGDYLPNPFIKGAQPEYLDHPLEDSVPVINTLAVQKFSVQIADCRYIAVEDYESLANEKHLREHDVLMTVDGGVSIGKVALFAEKIPATVDSHVCILRPSKLSPLALVYLLGSPLGQMQFRRAESGASGQTTVTEDDVRRFVFPTSVLSVIDQLALNAESRRVEIAVERKRLDADEIMLWNDIVKALS